MATRKTNRGQTIDLDALFSANKNVPAVGNMKVNANGDVIDSKGNIVKKREDRVREYYRDNPKSSTSASLKGQMPGLQPDTEAAAITKQNITDKKRQMEKEVISEVKQPDEFDAPAEQDPIGYREVHLPSGDIQMVPIYKEE